GMPGLEFHDDPREFLTAARTHLAVDPVLSTVVATVAEDAVRDDAAGVEHGLPHRWWLVVRDELGEVAGVGMRTAPFAPYPLFLLPMPTDAAAALAHVLHARGERVEGVNGALPAARTCAGELARLQGRAAETALHSRLHEATTVVDPDPVPGRLRLAREDEAPLALDWFEAFTRDADEQAGREAGSHHDLAEDLDGMRRRIAEERLWFWVDEEDRPVHLTAHNLPALGAARIGPVFTPREHRGKGYAGNAVARVARQLLDGGARACLYTDQANPTSNALYAALGFEPVVDMVEMRIG
ncbi:MAG TPA: GNAT family N-acetyltransferase, partial [Acidimicrobiales bacterium]|nr:GNAT family N-acetyltransferase [Acidimicrobiales bacterium]